MNIPKRLCTLPFVLLITGYLVNAQSTNALLWKVSGKDLTESSYIFGTYHLLGNPFLTEVPETEIPFKHAKGVVVETIIDSSKLMSISMMGIMRDNTISNLVSPEDFKLVSDALEKFSGMSLKSLDMLKPAQVNAMLVLLQAQQLNEKILVKYAGVPLDVHFAYNGKQSGKQVTALESMEEQVKLLFDHFTVEEQAQQLVGYVKQSDTMARLQVDMLNLYLQKNIDELYKLMESVPEELTGSSDFLLKDRNIKWVTVLPGLMRSGSQFIAVGVGHLPGKDGVLNLLRQAGYTVEPVVK